MPKIACPGCKKQYQLPDTAVGKTATCKKCGKKFRIGKPKPKQPVLASQQAVAAKAKSPAKPEAKPVAKSPAPVAADASDSFWDDTLTSEASSLAATSAVAPAVPAASGGFSTRSTAALPPSKAKPDKKKKKKKKKVVWGFDWGKAALGAGTLIVGGGLTYFSWTARGRISRGSAGLAIGGLFLMLNGLMGEEGIW
ncbi:MAG: hypothetical protein RH917_07700 [Lacipirellulaceae bacterium]